MWIETEKRAGTGWQREKAEVGRALGAGGVISQVAQGVRDEQLQEKREVLGGLALSFSPTPAPGDGTRGVDPYPGKPLIHRMSWPGPGPVCRHVKEKGNNAMGQFPCPVGAPRARARPAPPYSSSQRRGSP